MNKLITYTKNCSLLVVLLWFLSGTQLFAQQRLGDNMGNHKATMDLNMGAKNIVNAQGMAIGSATLTNTNVILDIASTNKVMVIPRVTNIANLTGTIDEGSLAFDVATSRFVIREAGAWSSFGSFNLSNGQIMIGNASGRAIPVALTGDITVSNTGVTTIGAGKVTINKLASGGTADANKVYGTNVSTGAPELISRADLAIPKYTQSERDALTGIANNYLIFNTSNRQLQIYDSSIPGWVALGSAPASSLPTVTTTAPGTVTEPDQFNVSGNVVSTGGFDVTSRGIAYSLTTAPTTSSYTVNAAAAGTGAFTVTLPNLTANTTYYARAFAINSVGTSYGNEITFTTVAAVPPTVTTTTPATNITNSGATSGGTVVSSKGSAVTARGVVIGTSTNPTLANAFFKTTDGAGVGAFTSDITGLNASTTYYIRAYATSAIGTGYGANVSFASSAASLPIVDLTSPVTKSGATQTGGGNIKSNGGAQITNYGVAWSTTNTFPTTRTTANSYSGNAGSVGTFTAPITGVAQNTTYYVWAYATNSQGTANGPSVTFTSNGPPVPGTPVVPAASNTVGSVTINGSITTDGGSPVTNKGFVYNTNGSPTLGASGSTDVNAGAGAGSFSSTVTSFTPGVTYYVRIYATNAIGGPIYGPQITFLAQPNGSVSYTSAGSYQWTVPTGVTSVRLQVAGASGGGQGGGFGSSGGIATGILSVTPGEILTIKVGGYGIASGGGSGNPIAGGFNGGGSGMTGGTTNGGSGGGASDVRRGTDNLNNRVIVGGGGGGSATGANGGNGGGSVGGDGLNASGTTLAGSGGSQSAGGYSPNNPGGGSFGTGGNAAFYGSNGTNGNGGGGGGYYGGGSGGMAQSGGGGSGYIGGVTSGAFGGSNTGNGYVIISW